MLLRAVGVHVLAFGVYLGITIALASIAGTAFTADGSEATFFITAVAAAWLIYLGGPTWLLILALVVLWWRRGGKRLVHTTIVLDLLLWAGPLLLLLLPFRRTRRLVLR